MRSSQFKPKELTLPPTPDCPDGRVVLMRVPNLQRLVMELPSGDVPSFIRNQVYGSLNGVKVDDKPFVVNETNSGEFSRFIAAVVRAALVSPRIVDVPDYDADQIAYDDLSPAEAMAVFQRVMPKVEDVQAVKSFRGEAPADVGAVSNGYHLQSTAVETAVH